MHLDFNLSQQLPPTLLYAGQTNFHNVHLHVHTKHWKFCTGFAKYIEELSPLITLDNTCGCGWWVCNKQFAESAAGCLLFFLFLLSEGIIGLYVVSMHRYAAKVLL